MTSLRNRLNISSERKLQIVQEISLGSEPKPSFYALLLTASMIATFGLVANSTPVIIGAMLVSPLMTPILGLSLALVRGSGKLLGHAARAEIVGVLLAISVPATFGLLPIHVEITPEMLSRTHPNLFDLLVAVFSGFAGAYAMIDERISPALPGVAIATAIVPPLANTGLLLGLRAYSGAWGSFLLFFANFLSILLVASLVFFAAGLAPKYKKVSRWDFFRRFGWATLGFLVMFVFLTQSLVGIIQARDLDRSITRIISEELQDLGNASLENQIHQLKGNDLNVLATVRASRILTPDLVQGLQDRLAKELNHPTNLTVRNTLAKDVRAPGAHARVMGQGLDGVTLDQKNGRAPSIIRVTEQVLWETIGRRPDFHLADVTYGRRPSGRVVVASLYGFRQPLPTEIAGMEQEIRDRLEDQDVSLLVSFIPTLLIGREGPGLFGWSYNQASTNREWEGKQKQIRQLVQELFKTHFPGLFPTEIYFQNFGEETNILIRTQGVGLMDEEGRKKLEQLLAAEANLKGRVVVWSKTETVVSEKGQSPFPDFINENLMKLQSKYLNSWDQLE